MKRNLVALIQKLLKNQGGEKSSSQEGSVQYDFEDKQRGISIRFYAHPNKDYFFLVYYRQKIVYQGRKIGNKFIRERYKKGDWESILEDLSRQEVFPFAKNEL